MDNPTDIKLFEPTNLILMAFAIKKVKRKIDQNKQRIVKIKGPTLVFQDQLVVGENAVIGWLDRRHPFPPLLPHDPYEYGKIASFIHALETSPENCNDLWDVLKVSKQEFIGGKDPNLADLHLLISMRKIGHSSWRLFGEKIDNYAT